MKMFKLFSRAAAFGLLLAITIPAQADDLQDANKLFKQGLHAQAMEKVNAYLVTKPKDAQARFLKGLILAEQGNTADAITVFTRLTQDYPELPEPYNNLAVLYAGQGQYEKAKEELEMAIRTNPTYATAHENLGDIYAKMASQAYDRALQLEKSNTNSNTKTKLALIHELFSKNTRTAGKPTVTAAIDTGVADAPQRRIQPTRHIRRCRQAPVLTAGCAAQTRVTATHSKPIQRRNVEVPRNGPRPGLPRTARNTSRSMPRNSRRLAAKAAARGKHSASSASPPPNPSASKCATPRSKLEDDKHASVSFKQTYRARHLNVVSSKTLNWVKTDGQWQIAEEHSGK